MFMLYLLTGKTIDNVINMGSYNYLGFAENNADFLKTVAARTQQYGLGVCSTRQEMGERLWRGMCVCVCGGGCVGWRVGLFCGHF
ncbi:unnamed protein product [Coregonus sp. 'balchen']|nr:unnamed protein product [Coregonus sp. 'balchen']